VENRKHGLPRIDLLRDTPAQVRFLSIEPLLEHLGPINLKGINWVIVGGESGPGARPNRAKSWSCEHCENWKSKKDKNICLSCYWAYPEKYSHVAMRQIRRVDLIWQGEEVAQYDKLKSDAAKSGLEIPQFVKDVLEKALK